MAGGGRDGGVVGRAREREGAWFVARLGRKAREGEGEDRGWPAMEESGAAAQKGIGGETRSVRGEMRATLRNQRAQ